jgi:hypothetical protein
MKGAYMKVLMINGSRRPILSGDEKKRMPAWVAFSGQIL